LWLPWRTKRANNGALSFRQALTHRALLYQQRHSTVLKNKPYRIVPLTRIVLLKLYVLHVDDDPRGKYSVDDVCEAFDVPVSRNLVETALERLYRESTRNNERLVSAVGKRGHGQNSYQISDQGILVVERALRNPSSDLSYYLKNGDAALDDVAGIQALFWTKEEFAETDDWQPLEFDHDSVEFTGAVEAIDKVIETVAASNEVAAQFPLEKYGILISLRQGLEWLKKQPSKAIINSLLLSPLHWLVATFGRGVIAEVAKKAAQRIVDLIGTVF
jgi:hypothetical protein